MLRSKGVSLFLVCLMMSPSSLFPQVIENFRQTNQRAALLGTFNEFVDANWEEAINRELRRNINRLTTSYNSADIGNFRLANNPNGQFFRPARELTEPHRNFLTQAAADNQIDILVLALMRESGVGIEVELQLFDARIMVLSAIERASFSFAQRVSAIEDLTYRAFDHLDREGFVHPNRQGFLQSPVGLRASQASDFQSGSADDFFILPRDLTGPSLAGRASIGGDKTPFWEEWWFWTLVFGGIAAAGGISYYFMVVERPPSKAQVTFTYQNP